MKGPRGLTWPSWFTPRHRTLALLFGSAAGYGLAFAGIVLLLTKPEAKPVEAEPVEA